MRTVFKVTVEGDLDDPEAEMNVRIELVEGRDLIDAVGVFIAAAKEGEGTVTFADGERALRETFQANREVAP